MVRRDLNILDQAEYKDTNVSFDVKEGKLFTNEIESLEEANKVINTKESFSNMASRNFILEKF